MPTTEHTVHPVVETLIAKLHPSHLNISPKMQAILACILGETWTTPRLSQIHITSDDVVMGVLEGDVGANDYIGALSDFSRNLAGVADCVELTREERTAFAFLANQHIITHHNAFSMVHVLDLR